MSIGSTEAVCYYLSDKIPCRYQGVGISMLPRALPESSMAGPTTKKKFRSQEWFNNPDNPGMTALYLERYLHDGLTRDELQCCNPLIGLAQTGSDLSPCHRQHLTLAKRVRLRIDEAGDVPFEFSCHPIQET